MAQAFPNSTVRDSTTTTIDRPRRQLAEAEGASKNTEFEVGRCQGLSRRGYDLVCFFDCLHDMGDPVGAMAHVREVIDDDGTVMLVEPFANDTLAENLNPVGRTFYAASTLICTPSSLDQEVGLGLGAQAGEEDFARCPRKLALRGFGGRRRHRSTWFSRHDRRPAMSFIVTHSDDCLESGSWRLVRRTLDLKAFGMNLVELAHRRGHSRARRDRPRPGGGVLRRGRHADPGGGWRRTTRRPRGPLRDWTPAHSRTMRNDGAEPAVRADRIRAHIERLPADGLGMTVAGGSLAAR